MKRREFLQAIFAATIVVCFGNLLPEEDAAAATTPSPPAPLGSRTKPGRLITIPFSVGRPRGERVFIPAMSRG